MRPALEDAVGLQPEDITSEALRGVKWVIINGYSYYGGVGPESRGQGIRNQGRGSKVRGPGTRVKDPRSRVQGPGSRI
jgi:hypothetical protein